MARLIKPDKIEEGIVFCRWVHNRLIRNNKNVLGVELGATGSGKSYRDLRKAELWYDYHFHEPFPIENICFGVAYLLKRVSSGKLRKGEVLIFEEAGVNLGALDFQQRVSKIFTYVLQSFRSMNIAIFFNLPYLSMLNKQARMLMHYSFESNGIDFQKKINKCKPFFHQVNQSTGKIYKKYLRIRYEGQVKTIKRLGFSLPSKRLMDAYEQKKQLYLTEITQEYADELDKLESDKLKKLGRPDLTEKQMQIFKLACEGHNQVKIAKILGKDPSVVNRSLKRIKEQGYVVKISPNAKKNG